MPSQQRYESKDGQRTIHVIRRPGDWQQSKPPQHATRMYVPDGLQPAGPELLRVLSAVNGVLLTARQLRNMTGSQASTTEQICQLRALTNGRLDIVVVAASPEIVTMTGWVDGEWVNESWSYAGPVAGRRLEQILMMAIVAEMIRAADLRRAIGVVADRSRAAFVGAVTAQPISRVEVQRPVYVPRAMIVLATLLVAVAATLTAVSSVG
jgi:hypothetical protein